MMQNSMLLWGNFSTALAYSILTIQMIWFIRNPKFTRLFFANTRGKLKAHGDLYLFIISIISLFSSFFIMCGCTHFMGVIHFYYPNNFDILYIQSSIMIICAIVSMIAAVVGFWIFPIILNTLDKFEFSNDGTIQHHDNYLLEAIEMIQESIIILTPDLKIVRGNQASKLIFGEKSINTDILECIHPMDKMLFFNTAKNVLNSHSFAPVTVELRVTRGESQSASPTTRADCFTIPSSSNRNQQWYSHTRIYCVDNISSCSTDEVTTEDLYVWIECTLCKGARMSAAGNFDYDLKMVSRNIDDRKKQAQYQSLIESTEEKARTNEAKMRYISCIAHDLKTPLQSFSFTMDLLGQTRLLGEQKDYLQQAAVAVDLMRLTISQTMDISKALTGAKLMPRRTTVHLSSVLQRVRVIIRSYGKQVPVSFEVAKEVCDTIITDEEWLWQMMLNLLTNACKYTDRGSIELKISTQAIATDTGASTKTQVVDAQKELLAVTNLLVCEIIDTGVGVREDKIATLFDAFAQVQDGQVTGTGLGLFGVRTRAEGLGGSCGARPNTQSSTGTGSVIWFAIPYVPDHSRTNSVSYKVVYENANVCTGKDHVSKFSENSSESDEDFPQSPHPVDKLGLRVEEAIRLQQLTAMVVEDSRVVRKLMERVLLKMGFARVECYENGSKGLEAMMAHQVDIVFSDVQMPIMTGPEMVSRFRKFEAEALEAGQRSRRQVIVAVTANGSECGDHQGFDDLCPKPVNRTDIYHIVSKHMNEFMV